MLKNRLPTKNLFTEQLKILSLMLSKIFTFLKSLYDSVIWFEIKNNKKNYRLKGNEKFIIIKSKNDSRLKIYKNYFNDYPSKKKDYREDIFFVLSKKHKTKLEILCTGWLYKGNEWIITEINKKIILKNVFLLFDFFTPKKLRNKGYYKKILIKISQKYKNNKLAIYSLIEISKVLKLSKMLVLNLRKN